MMDVKHTPTPWMVDPKEPGLIQGFDPREPGIPWIVAKCAGDAADWFENDEGEVNAAFIVRAVNAHDDLVEALEAVIRVADRNTVEFDLARAALAKATTRD